MPSQQNVKWKLTNFPCPQNWLTMIHRRKPKTACGEFLCPSSHESVVYAGRVEAVAAFAALVYS